MWYTCLKSTTYIAIVHTLIPTLFVCFFVLHPYIFLHFFKCFLFLYYYNSHMHYYKIKKCKVIYRDDVQKRMETRYIVIILRYTLWLNHVQSTSLHHLCIHVPNGYVGIYFCTWFNHQVYCSTIPIYLVSILFCTSSLYITLHFFNVFLSCFCTFFALFMYSGWFTSRSTTPWSLLVTVRVSNHANVQCESFNHNMLDGSVKIIIESKLTCICFVFSLCIKHKERRPWCDSNLLPACMHYETRRSLHAREILICSVSFVDNNS